VLAKLGAARHVAAGWAQRNTSRSGRPGISELTARPAWAEPPRFASFMGETG